MFHELSHREIDAFLRTQTIGHLGCSERGTPYVFPMAFAYDGISIYGQTTDGRKLQIVRGNPIVCFEVEERNNSAWTSVLCIGRFQELDFEALANGDAQHIITLLTKNLEKIQEQVGITVPFRIENGRIVPGKVDSRESTLFRIVPTELSGRRYIPGVP